jgi:hypothetical protein
MAGLIPLMGTTLRARRSGTLSFEAGNQTG